MVFRSGLSPLCRVQTGSITPMFYLLLCALFCDKNGNCAHNQRFLLQMKHKTADKALEQHFLKEFKATCKNSSESELKQQNEIRHRLVMH